MMPFFNLISTTKIKQSNWKDQQFQLAGLSKYGKSTIRRLIARINICANDPE
jgi:hypothetical protein